jgi:two-component sensor histidine kinase
MKIRQKLISGLILISLISGLVGILGLYANFQIVSSYESGEKHFGAILEASNEVSSYAKRAQGHTMLFLTLHNETDRMKAYQRITSLQEQIDILNSDITNPEAIGLLNKTKSKKEELHSTIESLFTLYDNEIQTNGTFDPRNHEELIRKLDDLSSNIRQNGLDLAKKEVTLQIDQNSKAKQEASSFYNLIFIISGLTVLTGLIVGLIFEKMISGPIKDLKDAFIQVKNGNYDVEIYTKSDDEIAALLNEFNKMAYDLKISNEKITRSLEEKEVLLREIHHRVKNNMQIVSSLLMLQSQNIEDKKYKDIFIDSQNRIQAMALIHQKLYQSESLAQINFKEYIDGIVSNIFESYGQKSNIKLDINIEKIPLNIDYAVPCGLIINELVTNSFKYAFPDGRQGIIKISAKSNDNNLIQLSISDDGIGIPKDLDIRNTESLGLQLVTSLAESQLHGEISLNREIGTEFQINFRQTK